MYMVRVAQAALDHRQLIILTVVDSEGTIQVEGWECEVVYDWLSNSYSFDILIFSPNLNNLMKHNLSVCV